MWALIALHPEGVGGKAVRGRGWGLHPEGPLDGWALRSSAQLGHGVVLGPCRDDRWFFSIKKMHKREPQEIVKQCREKHDVFL